MTTNLPIYKALIGDEADGIVNISLVDYPAVESDFVAFDKQEKPLMFTIINEMEHKITGVIMRCDFPIYRYDSYGEYYIMYDRETIEKMAQKLFRDGNHNNINIMHIDGSNVDGVEMLECYIKDSAKGITPVGFDDISDGSLFATYKIENDGIWQSIMDGTFKGFSLEGYFTVQPAEEVVEDVVEVDDIEDILGLIDQLSTLINKN